MVLKHDIRQNWWWCLALLDILPSKREVLSHLHDADRCFNYFAPFLRQEKGRMATDLKRLKQHFKAYEPTLKELERKYQASTSNTRNSDDQG